MFQNVIVGWLARRGLELGGLVAAAVTWYMTQTPAQQDAINRIFTGGWREVPIGIYLGIAVTLWGYVWSFRSTVQPQVVTQAGQKIVPKAGTVAQANIETQAKAAPKAPTIFESILARFGH